MRNHPFPASAKSLRTLALLLTVVLASTAYGQAPSCSDVFPAAVTANAQPPDVLTLPAFPSPNDGALTVSDGSTLNLGPGNYYYTSLTVENNATVNITGPVRIFVQNNAVINNNINFNNPGNPADLVVLVYGNATIGNNTTFNGILYAEGSIQLNNNTVVNGAVTARGAIATHPNTSTSYDASAVEQADFGGLCTQGGSGGVSGAIFAYFMEETQWTGASGEVADSSGNGLDATAVGGADTDDTDPAIAGSPGTCRYGDFSSASQRVTAPASSLVNNADSFTVAAWVKIPDGSQTTSTPSLIAYGNTLNDQWPERYELYMERNRYGQWWSTPNWDNWVLVVRKRNGNLSFLREPVQAAAAENPLSGSWVHVAAIYDATVDKARLYLNGSLAEDSGMSGPNELFDSSGGLGIMAHPGGQYDTQGFTDEVYMFGDALDAGEVTNLYQNTRPCQSSYDHIRLIHSTTALTCSPSDITVQACSDSNCTSLHPDPVNVDFTSPAANWTPDPVTFTGTATVTLQYTTPGVITLNANAITPPADNPTRCFSAGVETNCEMEFFDSGFVIDIADHVADSVVTGSIAAVRADPGNPEQCVPGFDNETKDIGFWSEYVNPSSGSLAVDIDGSPITTASPGSTRSISFDGNGIGSFSLQYPDVGDVEVNARYEGSGDEAGLIMLGEDRFIARPARFTLSIPGNPAATDENGDVFTTAATDFEMTVAARNASDNITPNFGKETPAEDVDLELSLVAPSGGVSPGLVGSFGAFGTDCNGSAAAAGTACGDFSWPEVGIISLNPRLLSGAYLGSADVVGTAVDHVGRFIPDHFELAAGTLINRAGISGCTGSPFTYIGERFDADFTLYARNADGNTTANYDGPFAFLGGSDLDLSGSEPSGTAGNPDVNAPSVTWLLGVGDASARLVLPRSSLEGPYPNYEVVTAPVDSDGVALGGNDVIGSTELRFGRLVIDNAIGSELGPLDLPWRGEYWDGSTWLINEDDDCTTINLANDVALTSSGGDTGVDGTTTVSLGSLGSGSTAIDSSCSVLTLGAAPSSCGTDPGPGAGKGRFRFTAPNAPGWVDLLLGLNTNWPYLRDELDDDNSTPYEENPEARATFGLFDGNSQRIFIREVAPQ